MKTIYRTNEGRIVTKEKDLGGGRWLCTDHRDKCHPCYNEDELEEVIPLDVCQKYCDFYDDSCQYSMCEDCGHVPANCDGTCSSVECYYGDSIDEIIMEYWNRWKKNEMV